MNYAGLPTSMRKGLWAEAANSAVMWDNATVHKSGEKPPFTQFYNKDPDYVKTLHPFGEMVIALDPTKKGIKAKLTNKGEIHMLLGPAEQHSHDACRLWNLRTRRVGTTRDIM